MRWRMRIVTGMSSFDQACFSPGQADGHSRGAPAVIASFGAPYTIPGFCGGYYLECRPVTRRRFASVTGISCADARSGANRHVRSSIAELPSTGISESKVLHYFSGREQEQFVFVSSHPRDRVSLADCFVDAAVGCSPGQGAGLGPGEVPARRLLASDGGAGRQGARQPVENNTLCRSRTGGVSGLAASYLEVGCRQRHSAARQRWRR